MRRSREVQATPEAPTRETPNAHAPTSSGRNGDELWSIKIVVQKTGLSRASIYRYVARNLFPPYRRVGPNRIAWLASEIVAWIHSRPRPDMHG
jgi:prophage regulatory protein